MYCQYCGQKLDNDATVCPSCGKRLPYKMGPEGKVIKIELQNLNIKKPLETPAQDDSLENMLPNEEIREEASDENFDETLENLELSENTEADETPEVIVEKRKGRTVLLFIAYLFAVVSLLAGLPAFANVTTIYCYNLYPGIDNTSLFSIVQNNAFLFPLVNGGQPLSQDMFNTMCNNIEITLMFICMVSLIFGGVGAVSSLIALIFDLISLRKSSKLEKMLSLVCLLVVIAGMFASVFSILQILPFMNGGAA